jgi:hypothetical protein
VRTLLYEAANVMLTRYRGALALKEWAMGIARRFLRSQTTSDGVGQDRTCRRHRLVLYCCCSMILAGTDLLRWPRASE